VTGIANLCHYIWATANIPGPQSYPVFAVVNQMADTAQAGFSRDLADTILGQRGCQPQVVVGMLDIGFLRMAVGTQCGGRPICSP
jgi:hypothetical protein